MHSQYLWVTHHAELRSSAQILSKPVLTPVKLDVNVHQLVVAWLSVSPKIDKAIKNVAILINDVLAKAHSNDKHEILLIFYKFEKMSLFVIASKFKAGM